MKTPHRAERVRSRLQRCLLVGLLALAGAAAGCATEETGFVVGEVYPAAKKQTKSLNIQVFRDDTVIRFTNTTANSLPACTMWINAWFSNEFKGLAVGESVEMSLFDFKDQYGDTFRAGGFFATQKPTRLVLAQLEYENELVGLIVVGDYE